MPLAARSGLECCILHPARTGRSDHPLSKHATPLQPEKESSDAEGCAPQKQVRRHLIVHWHSPLSHEQGHHSTICVCILLRAQYQGGKILQPARSQAHDRDSHTSFICRTSRPHVASSPRELGQGHGSSVTSFLVGVESSPTQGPTGAVVSTASNRSCMVSYLRLFHQAAHLANLLAPCNGLAGALVERPWEHEVDSGASIVLCTISFEQTHHVKDETHSSRLGPKS